ncbi:MAG: response regulator [Desulfobacteraceae bacterium]|nr:response regulator [Desulfobacteraceae bacterium]
MKSIIEWLIQMEEMSGQLYAAAKTVFRDDAVQDFLGQAIIDESMHARVMRRAAETIDGHQHIVEAISFDEEYKEKHQAPLRNALDKLVSGAMSQTAFIDCIVETEFSEWNDIFIFVVNSLADIRPEFRDVAPQIQQHLRRTEHFLNTVASDKQKIEMIRKLRPVWTERILIVDDDPDIRDLLKAILKREGEVDVAENGEAAMEKLEQKYFRLIISDVEMPVLGGRDFFKAAKKIYPDIGNRFLFLTGDHRSETITFFEENNLRYLQKPASIKDILDITLETLHDIH